MDEEKIEIISLRILSFLKKYKAKKSAFFLEKIKNFNFKNFFNQKFPFSFFGRSPSLDGWRMPSTSWWTLYRTMSRGFGLPRANEVLQ
jgi:hypothetical protein